MENETFVQKLERERIERKEEILKEIYAIESEDEWTPPLGLPIPFKNQILLLPAVQKDRKTPSGIFLRGNGDKEGDTKIGIIARLGADVSLPIKISQRVLFDAYQNYFQILHSDGNTYLVVNEHNIYCAVTPETYIVPAFKGRMEKRNDSRREGLENVKKLEALDIENPKGNA